MNSHYFFSRFKSQVELAHSDHQRLSTRLQARDQDYFDASAKLSTAQSELGELSNQMHSKLTEIESLKSECQVLDS
jgi:chromosome segregation ATPase